LQPGALESARAIFKELLSASNVTAKPEAKDYKAICLFCAKEMVVNLSKMQLHISSKCSPDHLQKAEFSTDMAGSKTASALLGKRANAELQSVRDEHEQASGKAPRSGQSSASGASSRAPCSTCGCKCGGSGIDKHFDRELADNEIKSIDQALARFCYAEGLGFAVLMSEYLHKALAKLYASWAAKTKLSDWNLRHRFLTKEAETVAERVAAAIAAAFVLTLISDGWCGVQKEHQLNIMLATPKPFFIENVFTKVSLRAARARTRRMGRGLLGEGIASHTHAARQPPPSSHLPPSARAGRSCRRRLPG
jgi:hypothetical protein